MKLSQKLESESLHRQPELDCRVLLLKSLLTCFLHNWAVGFWKENYNEKEKRFYVGGVARSSFDYWNFAGGTYPAKLDKVAVDFPHMVGHVEQLLSLNANVKDAISNKDWSLQIQSNTSSGTGACCEKFWRGSSILVLQQIKIVLCCSDALSKKTPRSLSGVFCKK